MATVEAAVEIAVPPADVWDLYFDGDRWASWVDGFEAVIAAEGYPGTGGSLTWRSNAAGRGEVRERVTAHEPRTLHRVEFEDPETRGTLETRFEIVPGPDRTTRVIQRLTYELRGGGPFGAIADLLFIRTQMRRSLERSLGALGLEANG
ncbi:MAG TPA: SRPBCC family protein [Solirubrobacterales bacterium]|nr:SRPBCC family protein [Solirubrobacterales bacterium]